MNKKIIGLLVGLIIVISSVLVYINFNDEISDIFGEDDQEIDTSDILDEIDESLLEEDDEIEIGEMV